MLVHLMSRSKQTSFPPGASPRAMLMELVPVNVPTSTAHFAPMAPTSRVMRLDCSGLIAMMLMSPRLSVSA